jgi:hypothetical protein
MKVHVMNLSEPSIYLLGLCSLKLLTDCVIYYEI